MLTKEVQSFHVRNLVFRNTILPQGCTTFRLQRFHFIIDAKNKFSLIISNDWVYELHPSYPRDTHMRNKVFAKHPGLNYENIWNGSIWKRDWEFSNFRSRHRLRMSSWIFWTNGYKYEKQRNTRHTHTKRKMENKKVSVNIWSTLRVHGMMDSWIKIQAVTFGLTKGRNLTGFIQFTTPTQS